MADIDNEDILEKLSEAVHELNNMKWVPGEDLGTTLHYLNVSFGGFHNPWEYTTDIKPYLQQTGVFTDDEMLTAKWLFDLGERINDMHALIVFIDQKILETISQS
jgi:hypothetical protein